MPDSGLWFFRTSGGVSGIVILPGTLLYETEVAGHQIRHFLFIMVVDLACFKLAKMPGAPFVFFEWCNNPYEKALLSNSRRSFTACGLADA